MTDLSPAAQAVLDAFNSVPYYPDENDEGMAEFDDVIRTSDIVAIANELDEGAQ